MKRSTITRLSRLAHWLTEWGYYGGIFTTIAIQVLTVVWLVLGFSSGGFMTALPLRINMSHLFETAHATMADGVVRFVPSWGWFVTGDGTLLGLLIMVLPATIVCALITRAYFHLMGFTDTLQKMRPFDVKNGTRFRAAGILFGAAFISDLVGGVIRQSYGRSIFELNQGEITLSPTVHYSLIVIAAFLFIFSEAFRIGADLQDNDDRTI